MQKRTLVVTLFAVAFALFPAVAAKSADRSVLFAADSGFTHARTAREPVLVQRTDWFGPAMRYWNRRAGWEMFVFSDAPEITANYVTSCSMCAYAYSSVTHVVGWSEPYERCEISIAPWRRDELATVAHEMGHCLGLRHQIKGVMRSTAGGKIQRGWKTFDRGLLRSAGYADAS